ncbi:DUF4261 domain-containing protein [Gilliamella sp. ESL0250]|uniref:DUF4261 domain-containing protein n=1 Tax=Gilliamella sp. ESL0250 TaxID=2705036 RepID=UPI001580C247|nr:DUF4261 domain-containing protein [Gilliamella sp. ESL0250]NUF50126.1 DUF4261 domain-containing protein [Gilliamella sp. ESL0250]
MSLFSRLFSRWDNKIRQSDDILVANSSIENPLSLVVLFNDNLSFNRHKLLKTLRKVDSSMKNIRLPSSIEQITDGADTLVAWGQHIIKIVGFNAPCPSEILQPCIENSQNTQELKQQVSNHQSHVILYYVGFEEDLVEQYVALTQFAVGFEYCDMSALINAKAHQILATHVASALANEQQGVYLLRNCLPLFFIGFVEFNVDHFDGVWMRTYGADAFGLPDLAILANSYEDSEKYMNMFNNLLLYLRDSGAAIQAGHTTEDTEGKKMLLRSPSAQESFLQNGGMVLVMEYLVE